MRKVKKLSDLNWVEPKVNSSSRKGVNEDYLLLARAVPEEHGNKNPNVYVKLYRAGCEKYLGESETMCFVFDEEGIITAFQPKSELKQYTYDLKPSTNDKLIYNLDLVNKIYDHFKLDRKVTKFKLKINPLYKLQGVDLFSLEPCDWSTNEPLLTK